MSSAPHERWTQFLVEEESFIRECRDTLRQVREMLKTPTLEAAENALRLQESLHLSVAIRREQRRAWCDERPAERPGSLSPELEDRRRHLRQDARSLANELRIQAMFLRASLDCYQAVFTDLFGGSVTEGRYGRHGKHNPTADLVFVETRG